MSENENRENVNGASGAQRLEDLPEYWQREIRSLRDECAQRRTSESALNTQLQQLRDDMSQREATITSQLSDAQLTHARYRAAVNAGIPKDKIDDFASRLRGSNADEIANDASSLAQLFQTPTPTGVSEAPSNGGALAPTGGVDHSQGRGNRNDSAPVTPAAQLRDLIQSQLGRD